MLKSQVAGAAYMNFPLQFQDTGSQNDPDPLTKSESNRIGSSTVNFVNFNQDASCIAVGLNNGYRIYSCRPSFSKCYLIKKEVSIGLVEMLYCTSLLAIVALGEEPGSLPRKLKVVNTKRQTAICDLIFPTSVLLVKLSKCRMVVLLEEQIYVYDIATMKLLHTIETSPNSNRLCAVSDNTDDEVGSSFLAYPSPPKTIAHDSLLVSGVNTNGGLNSVQNNIQSVSNAPNRVGDVIIFDLKSLQPLAVIEAHKSALAAMCLSVDGSLLATASDKGTIVRVFNVETGLKLYQFRRGTYPTKIFSLSFSRDNKYVVATSSSETVHIFRLGEEELLANKQKQKKDSKKKTKLNPDYGTIEEENESITGAPPRLEFDEDDIMEDDGDDSDAEAEVDVEGDGDAECDDGSVELPVKQRKLSQGSTNSFKSFNSGISNDELKDKTEPVIDQNRLSVARIIRRSSQTLGRKAAQKMGDFLPSRFSSILEPTRHFASLKIQTLTKDVRSIAMMNNETQEDLVSIGSLPLRESGSENSLRPISSPSSHHSAKEILAVNLIHINVVTSEGYYYTYGLDPERGGDCILLHQYSLLDD
ncbi:CIC11C00000002928 [Sungouiella intermedia]|uniref:CIC11C00000002928 n=1 Tax=Sungouiella intermedia TaxID=45354 RepID=A0A1L0CTA0_9ASCO|nr:CIC11C00000002928 [[Candida] intermedia]